MRPTPLRYQSATSLTSPCLIPDASRGYSVFLCNTDDDPAKEARYLDVLLRRRVEGIVIVPTAASAAALQQARRRQMPIVQVHRKLDDVGADSVRADSRGGAAALTEQLLALGHRRVAYLGGLPTISPTRASVDGWSTGAPPRPVPPWRRRGAMLRGTVEPGGNRAPPWLPSYPAARQRPAPSGRHRAGWCGVVAAALVARVIRVPSVVGAGTPRAAPAGVAGARAPGEEVAMIAQPFGPDNAALVRIDEGMDVVDAAGEKVGTVKQVYLGGEELGETAIVGDSALNDVPEGLRGSLAASGFVEIATGFLQANRYATGAQVAAVEGGAVRLAVGKDELARG